MIRPTVGSVRPSVSATRGASMAGRKRAMAASFSGRLRAFIIPPNQPTALWL
ncbi:MAG: hypothetical protein ABL998_06270 [Planctomycetota bacterium]